MNHYTLIKSCRPSCPSFADHQSAQKPCCRAPPASLFASTTLKGAVPMPKSKQLSLFNNQKPQKAHGGSLAVDKRRSKRPINIKQSHHITMKSHHAVGSRSLFRYKKIIVQLMKKNAIKFHIKVYEYSIQGNHLHLLVKAQNLEGLQNFFRVLAGHTAQRILKECPIKQSAGGASQKRKGCKKNQRKFWSYLLFSRIVSWGREFQRVISYVQKNTLELLQVIAYQPRLKSKRSNTS